MSSSYPPGGEYDERLLASIPAASRAEKQEGYNINLLGKEQDSSPAPQNPPSNLGHTNGNLEAGPSSKEALSSRHYQTSDSYTHKPVPWYRLGKWRVGMLVGAIIIIAAVVGGAVGGTVGKHKNNNNTVSGPSTVSITTAPPVNSHGSVGGNSGSAAPVQGSATGSVGVTTDNLLVGSQPQATSN